MKILVVDDSPSIRTVIKGFILKAVPHAEVLEAGDGIMAEVILQECYVTDAPVHIIFLDWMMPRLSGREFLSNIRGIDQFKEKPSIVMLTAETYPEQINSVVKHKVSSYVTKPFTAEDIALAIEKIVQERSKEKDIAS